MELGMTLIMFSTPTNQPNLTLYTRLCQLSNNVSQYEWSTRIRKIVGIYPKNIFFIHTAILSSRHRDE